MPIIYFVLIITNPSHAVGRYRVFRWITSQAFIPSDYTEKTTKALQQTTPWLNIKAHNIRLIIPIKREPINLRPINLRPHKAKIVIVASSRRRWIGGRFLTNFYRWMAWNMSEWLEIMTMLFQVQTELSNRTMMLIVKQQHEYKYLGVSEWFTTSE